MHPPFFFVLAKKNAPCTVEEKAVSSKLACTGKFGDADGCWPRPDKTRRVSSRCAETLLSNYAYAATCLASAYFRVLIEALHFWPRCRFVGGVSKEGAVAPSFGRLKGGPGGGKSAKRRLRRIKRADFRGSGTIDGPDTGRESYRRNGGPRPKSPSWRVFWTGRGPFSPRGENGGASAQLSSWLSPKKKERPPPGSPSFKTAPPGPAAHHRRWCAAAGRSHSTAGRQWPFSG